MGQSVSVHRHTRHVRKFTEALKEQLLEHIVMGNTLASFLWRIRNSALAISKAAIHQQLFRDPEFRKHYQLAREVGADLIYGKSIGIVNASQSLRFKRPSLAIMKNWWPKNKSKERQALIQIIRLLDRYQDHSVQHRALENDAKQ